MTGIYICHIKGGISAGLGTDPSDFLFFCNEHLFFASNSLQQDYLNGKPDNIQPQSGL